MTAVEIAEQLYRFKSICRGCNAAVEVEKQL